MWNNHNIIIYAQYKIRYTKYNIVVNYDRKTEEDSQLGCSRLIFRA
jgi:hypothetical protein